MIRKRSDGRFEGRYIYNGKVKCIYNKNKSKVEAKLKKIEAKIMLDNYFEPTKINLTTWLDTWLFEYKKKNIKDTTFSNYKHLIDLYIIPEIGNFSLDKLNNILIQKFVNNIKHSSRTIKYVYTILKMALKQAVSIKLIQSNPCDNINLPKQTKKEIKIFDDEEFNQFLNAIKDHLNGCAFYLAITTGMRKGEILALKWQNIDFKSNLIFVEKTLSRTKVYDDEKNSSYKTIETDAKTDKSKRIIPILPELKNRLEAHHTMCKIEAFKKGRRITENCYVFQTKNNNPISPRNFSKQFYCILKNNGISKNKFHILRHTYASVALGNGVDLKIISELLGHSSYSFTADTYCHVLTNKKIKEISKLKDAFRL